MNGQFAIRCARAEDGRELARLFRRSVREIASRDYRPVQIEAWVAAPGEFSDWTERLATRIALVAETKECIAGFIQFEPPDHIDMIYVNPDWQRMGVASALLAALESHASEMGTAILNVEASITSRPFFERQGYIVSTPQFVTVRGQDFLNYRMTKRLTGAPKVSAHR